MRTLILYDTPATSEGLYPFTLTRPVGALRNGILSIRERWERRTGGPVYLLSKPYLQQGYEWPVSGQCLMVDAACWPDDATWSRIKQLQPGETMGDNQGLIAYCSEQPPAWLQFPVWPVQAYTVEEQYRLTWSVQLVQDNIRWMRYDLDLLNLAVQDAIHATNTRFGEYPVIIHPTANVRACTLNAEEGAVVIDEGALVMEGSHLRGPVYVGKKAVVKMGTNLYPGANIGPHCTVGGEVKNSILIGYTNTAHEGYLGDSVLGEWCNLGAGTFVSNVKNNAGTIRVWHGHTREEMAAGEKMGCLIGDFSRTAILTAINSGTTIGACCSLHQPLHPGKHVPSFWWGHEQGYLLEKAIADAEKWMALKKQSPPDTLRPILTHIFETLVSPKQ